MRKLLLLLALSIILAACSSEPRPTPTPNPFEVFRTVRNDCGTCGTDSPAGGWEAADGRTLILSEKGNYSATFTDGSSLRGTWEQSGSRLCLQTGDAETCFSYQQKVDAMKLDDGIYIRR